MDYCWLQTNAQIGERIEIAAPIRLLASTVGPKCGFVEDSEEDDDEMWLVNFRNVSLYKYLIEKVGDSSGSQSFRVTE